jgi:chromatin remodeling complex protein RSC6
VDELEITEFSRCAIALQKFQLGGWIVSLHWVRTGLLRPICNDCEWTGSYNADFRTARVSLEVIHRVFRFREVNLTPNKKGSFGGYGIELDSALATVLGGREGQKISPSEMTKRIWAYVKHHNLGKKSN